MSEEGYRARIWAIEWHVRLWEKRDGTALCVRMMDYCSRCVEADFYGVPRPEPTGTDEEIEYLKSCEILFDACVFSGNGPQSFA